MRVTVGLVFKVPEGTDPEEVADFVLGAREDLPMHVLPEYIGPSMDEEEYDYPEVVVL